METEPAERQEKIPTESQKEKERGRKRERDCKGNESLLRLGKKLLQRGGGGMRGKEKKE